MGPGLLIHTLGPIWMGSDRAHKLLSPKIRKELLQVINETDHRYLFIPIISSQLSEATALTQEE